MGKYIWENQFLHGCDYNPDQWLDRPDILKADIELMKKAGINCVSLGIFAWARLEPQEGVYDFEWLSKIIDDLYDNGIYTILSTPSGARPMWMSHKYPEVLRVGRDLNRIPPMGRHNHCYTSPIYRKKVWDINRLLSQRFGNHPAVILWHLSNEYSGECYCEMCQIKFREWLKEKYKTLDNLNQQWWSAFWSHTFTDWEQIHAPSGTKDDNPIHGIALDWKRFATYQTADFCLQEKQAIRAGGSDIPVTANFMVFFEGLNYYKFKDILDVISLDSYPEWHKDEDDVEMAILTACSHDLMRSIKKKPFLLMESTPSMTNWQTASRLKRPEMHMLSSIQALAHGTNSVQYFQWRKCRGGYEKFHGAVVGHTGAANTRVFSDVSQLGQRLKDLSGIAGTGFKAEVAIIYDWENRWAIDGIKGLRNNGMNYLETVISHYKAFWQLGITVDLPDMECDFSQYKLVVAPMLYLQHANIVQKLRSFVENGGILVGTYNSGVVNENDLCHENPMPNGLTDVFGIEAEEIDSLHDNQFNQLQWQGRLYKITELCERIHPTTANTLAVYEKEFYSGESVFTSNSFGQGAAYYIAAKAEDSFYSDFYKNVVQLHKLDSHTISNLPYGVTCSARHADKTVYILQNYNQAPATVLLQEKLKDWETDEQYSENIILKPYEAKFLIKN